jgi:hypothetical protein
VNATLTAQLNPDLFAFARADVLKKHFEIGGSYLVKDVVDRAALQYNFDLKDGSVANHHVAGVIEKKLDDNTLTRVKAESKDQLTITSVF